MLYFINVCVFSDLHIIFILTVFVFSLWLRFLNNIEFILLLDKYEILLKFLFKACMSKYSAGCIYYYPSFHSTHNPSQAEKLQNELKRYLTRKIGFEAVMRIRCTKGMTL